MIWVNNMSFFNTLFQWCMKYCVFSKGTKTKQKQPLFCMHCDSFRSFCCSKDNDKQFMSLLYNTLVKYKGCTNVISFWKKSVLRIVVCVSNSLCMFVYPRDMYTFFWEQVATICAVHYIGLLYTILVVLLVYVIPPWSEHFFGNDLPQFVWYTIWLVVYT